MNKKILIIGAAGFIGANLVRYLLYSKNNYSVIGVDRIDNSKNIHNVYTNKSSDFYIADICDDSIMNRILEISRPDIIINLISEKYSLDSLPSLLSSIFHYKECCNSNVEFIQLSSVNLYKDEAGVSEGSDLFANRSDEIYGICAETLINNYCSLYSIPYNIIRSDALFGPRQGDPQNIITHIYKSYKDEGKVTLFNKGSTKRNLMYIEDFNSAVVNIIESDSKNETYNVSSGSDFTDIEIAFMIKEKFKKESEILFSECNLKERYYEVNTDKIRALGWKPKVSIKGRINQTIDWFEKNPWFDK